MKRALGTLLVAAVALAALLVGGALRDEPGDAQAGAAPPPALEQQVRADPTNADLRVQLAESYQQRVRETGDPSFYSLAERQLDRALELDPGHLGALLASSALAGSRHQFDRGLRLARRAQRLAPDEPRVYGALGDALVELGRYDEGFRAFDRMAALKPGIGAYARVAHAESLRGNTRETLRALRLALSAARGRGEPEAWAHSQIGEQLLGSGDAEAAADEYRASIAAFRGYAPGLHGLAQAEWAMGNTERAIELERRAVALSPQSGYIIQLAELLEFSGDRRGAAEQYARVEAAEEREAEHGVRTALETAGFRADLGIRPRQTLAMARRAQRQRPSLFGDEVLGWALARAGRCEEARSVMRRTMRLSNSDPHPMFYMGMIERCLGNHGVARQWFRRALEAGPYFSVRWVPVARRLAAG